MAPSRPSSSRLGEILVRNQIITRDQLDRALDRQKRQGSGRLGEHLIALGFLSEKDLSQQLAKQFGIPVIDPSQIEVPAEILGLIPPALARKNLIIPVSLSGSTLTVVMADPSNYLALNEVKFLTGYDVRPAVATTKAVEKALDRLFSDATAYDQVLSKLEETHFEVLREQETVDLQELERASEDAPVIALVNAVFADAIKKRASDVHIEPYERYLRVRFRIDGILQEIMKPPLQLKNPIVSRIKIMSDLDVAERRLSQDGRIKLKMGPGREIDVRVSILPTYAGEKVVLRILDKTALELDLNKLGFWGSDLEILRAAYSKPHGMVLVTGPTGSGKTTTLYAMVSELNKASVNISTAEDPIEYNIAGVNQVQINEGIGRTFSYCLRALLRQDPDVIMVGEIRDFETAEIALKAALTGHLVLSTLHTNDAVSTVARLLNIGLEPSLLTAALNLVMAQRLIRKLCIRCRQRTPVDVEELLALGIPEEEIGRFEIFRPVGCEECYGTGYHGRTAIYEMLSVTEEINQHILRANDGGASLKRRALECGMRTLRQAALQKLREGITSIEEVVRVTAPD